MQQHQQYQPQQQLMPMPAQAPPLPPPGYEALGPFFSHMLTRLGATEQELLRQGQSVNLLHSMMADTKRELIVTKNEIAAQINSSSDRVDASNKELMDMMQQVLARDRVGTTTFQEASTSYSKTNAPSMQAEWAALRAEERAGNLIIRGLPEAKSETSQQLKTAVVDLFATRAVPSCMRHMALEERMRELSAGIRATTRLGVQRAGSDRMVKVEFKTVQLKLQAMVAAPGLAGTRISFDHDLTREQQGIRVGKQAEIEAILKADATARIRWRTEAPTEYFVVRGRAARVGRTADEAVPATA
jgi:hypothetical protein